MNIDIIPKILFIAPYKEMGDMALKVANELGINLITEVSYMEDAVMVVNNAKREGIDFVIARGATAAIIKEECDVHVIEMHQNNLEILRAIQSATKYGSNIALVWYNEIPYKEDLIYNLLQIDVHFYSYQSKKDIEQIMHSLKKEEIDVIIGGIYTSTYAEKLGIKGIIVQCDEQSILWTLNYAKEIINIKKVEEVKRTKIETIVDNVHDGIISIDSNDIITIFNPMAENILNLRAKDIIGKKVTEVFHNSRLVSVIKGDNRLNEIIEFKDIKITANKLDLNIKDEVVGSVITFQDITKIMQLEKNIRRKLHSKGHIARYEFDDIIGEHQSLRGAKTIARKFATSDETILIMGESGTGKEMFAQSIHNESNRRNGPFIAVNCAEFNESLFESELFGYEEGAFTGARKGGKEGLVSLAHNGTLFLDEISELPINFQTSILRVIQERTIRPVGSDKIIPIDVRIIAASNKDLFQLMKENKFRNDLYYRINVLNVKLPSLRERIDDVELIIKHLVESKKSIYFTDEVMGLLKEYTWPGNVRELVNLIRRIEIVFDHGIVTYDNLLQVMPEINNRLNNKNNSKVMIKPGTLDKVIKEVILQAMEQYNGNQSEVARVLGVSRTFIWKKLKEL